MAMPDATPALTERVEPNMAIEHTVVQAARAAADRPVAGLRPVHGRARQSAPAAWAASAAKAVQRALSGERPWSTVRARRRRPWSRAQPAAT